MFYNKIVTRKVNKVDKTIATSFFQILEDKKSTYLIKYLKVIENRGS